MTPNDFNDIKEQLATLSDFALISAGANGRIEAVLNHYTKMEEKSRKTLFILGFITMVAAIIAAIFSFIE